MVGLLHTYNSCFIFSALPSFILIWAWDHHYFRFVFKKRAWLKKNCLILLEALKRCYWLRPGAMGWKLHCLPQMMQVHDKLCLDLDTHRLHLAQALRTLLCCHNRDRPQQLSETLLNMLIHSDLLTVLGLKTKSYISSRHIPMYPRFDVFHLCPSSTRWWLFKWKCP